MSLFQYNFFPFTSGTFCGILETFLFLFLKELGCSPFLMGLTITGGGLSGIIVLIVSHWIVKRCGHVHVICLGFLFYSIRFFGNFLSNLFVFMYCWQKCFV